MLRLFLLLAGLAGAIAAQAPPPEQAFVNKYCAGCHNEKLKSGGFSWTKVDLAHPDQTAAEAEKAINMLKVGMMPPPGMPRPDSAAIRAFADGLAARIDQVAKAHPDPGTPPLHRLNRTEYHNAVRDMLGLDVDVSSMLPADDMSHGFDNMADVLTVSPALMEGYIRAAGKISRLAVGDPRATPVTQTFQAVKNVNQMRHVEGAPYGTRGGISVIYNFPADGEYVFKTLFYHDIDGPFWGKNQGKGQQLEISINGERVALLTLDPNMMPTDTRQTEAVKVKAGPQRVSAAFLPKFEGPIEDFPSPVENVLIDTTHADLPGLTSLPHLRELTIIGPNKVEGISETPSRRAILACQPANASDEVPCAKKIIAKLARVGYRRPASDSDLEDLLSFYQKGRNQGGNFDSGIQAVVQTILSDPEFVFRFEHTPASAAPGTNFRIGDLELASRLSFFLWSSIPDDTLITLASQNKLHEPAVLETQVRRMLHDPKSESLATVFGYQWLHLQNLNDVQPDAFLFPNFDKNLIASMRRETEMLFDSVVHEDRSILDLLNANYTFVDEILARHYGIPNVLGTRFRRVTLTDENRFGLLGQASILTLTSVSNRTSIVQRGKYVMQVLLGTPPPPPPPNVPALKDNDETSKPQSVREKMEMHRKMEPCHSCHQLMDPIGLALENFDGVGQWRTFDSGMPVDASTKMFDGESLNGPVSLRKAILSHSDVFTGTLIQNLLAYGLGRVVDSREMPVIRAIQHQAARDDNRFSAVVLGIVNSAPFQMRRVDEAKLERKSGGTN
jgi:cytochrome c551/c552